MPEPTTSSPQDPTNGQTQPGQDPAPNTGQEPNSPTLPPAPPPPTDQNDSKDDDPGQQGGEQESKKDQDTGAPENYEEFTVPEGYALDEDRLGEFKELAKSLDLNQEGAQKLVDFGTKMQQSTLDAQADQWADIRKGWVEEIKNDKEFGGAHFDETVERANRALRQFGDDKMIEFLKTTGYGDNPALVRMLAKIDKAVGEHTMGDGGPATNDSADVFDRAAGKLYDKQ